jgi:hypothetical protein
MSERSQQILSRFPAHLEAARRGKQLAAVTDALASDLDVATDRLAAIRRAHRIGDADELRDVLLLGGLHAIGPAELAVLTARAEAMQKLEAALAQAFDDSAGRAKAADALLDLWEIAGDARLALFAPAAKPPATADLAAAARALAAAVRMQLDYRHSVAAARNGVTRTCQIHAGGNGTVGCILAAAANALDLDIDVARNAAVRDALVASGATDQLRLSIGDGFFHSADLFWHSTFVRNRSPLLRTVPSLAPDKLVRMNETIAVSELADQMLMRAADVVAAMVKAGIAPARPDAVIDLATAEAVAKLFDFAVERFARGVATMDATITVADLARQIGVATGGIAARLAALDTAGATRDTSLAPETAVVVARKYGFRLDQRLGPDFELLGIEENPLRREMAGDEKCFDGHRFDVVRRGFGRESLRTEIAAVDNLTWGPMIVNRDEGRGCGFFGNVPAGKTLILTEDGKAALVTKSGDAVLDSVDVTNLAFSWRGACFADAGKPGKHDFTFDGAGTAFATATPEGALDRDFVFPHAGNPIEVPGIGVGVTRMAFFVQEAHLSARDGPPPSPPPVRAVTPHYAIGFADHSVFAPPPPDKDTYPVQADVTLSWLEHEAYVVRVIIPSRFRLIDRDGVATTDLVAAALERFRPAGVTIHVAYHEDSWVLGQGTVLAQDSQNPNLLLLDGTKLWATTSN